MSINDVSLQVTQPKEYLIRFLKQDTRSDGRGVHQVRDVRVECDTWKHALGSASVQFGNTKVTGGVMGRLSNEPVRRNQLCTVAVRLSAVCGVQFADHNERGGSTLEKEVSARLQAILQRPLISAEQLELRYLLPPEVTLGVDEQQQSVSADQADDAPLLCWNLAVELVCTDYSGNCFDAALMCMVEALRNVRLPTVRRVDDDEVLLCGGARYVRSRLGTQPVRLDVFPVSLTFAVIDEYIVADPSDREVAQQSGTVCVVLDASKKDCDNVLALRKPGGAPLTFPALEQCIEVAKTHCKAIRSARWKLKKKKTQKKKSK